MYKIKRSCEIFGLALLCGLLISACAPRIMDTDRSPESLLPVADSAQLPQVIRDLLQQADQQYLQGKPNEALVTLERAVRIKPRYPEIWSRMAQIYYQQNMLQQARQHAERSNSYIRNNPALREFNNQLIQLSTSPRAEYQAHRPTGDFS